MASDNPSSSACWTCRIRKKKCSGEYPACSVCDGLTVPCYGFGPKPQWMNEASEKARKIEEIKRTVKQKTDASRRSRALQSLRRHGPLESPSSSSTEVSHSESNKGDNVLFDVVFCSGPPLGAISPDLWDSTASSGDTSHADISAGSTRGMDQSCPADRRLSLFKRTPLFSTRGGPTTSYTFPHHAEAVLLMHFFDHVFPLQFPFYQPPISSGGRGWVLALILQAPPLYNAALSLAAYHQNVTTYGGISSVPNGARKLELHFYARAISGLRQHVENLGQKNPTEGLRDSIEILACVIQLILLEVSKGCTETWYHHMRAAPDLFVFLRTYCTPADPLWPTTKTILDDPSVTHPSFCKTFALTLIDHRAMEFYTTALLWFDILACASTSLLPLYPDICAAALGPSEMASKVQLQNIMGCRNWVMILIREIGILRARKKGEGSRAGRTELARGARDISERLEAGIEELEGLTSRDVDGDTKLHDEDDGVEKQRQDLISRITQIFALATRIYLHTTLILISGSSLPASYVPTTTLTSAVSQTITALTSLTSPIPAITSFSSSASSTSPYLLRHVLWPFCIAACMATDKAQRDVFRALAASAGFAVEGGAGRDRCGQTAFGSGPRAWEVVECCWRIRDEDGVGSNCDWAIAMDRLGVVVLLV